MGYCKYDFKTHQIYVSYDVVFHESIFSYHDLSSPPLKNSITITPIGEDGTFDYSTTPLIVSTDFFLRDSIPHNLIDIPMILQRLFSHLLNLVAQRILLLFPITFPLLIALQWHLLL